MQNVTTLPKAIEPASVPRLPDWLERACEQEHPDIPWQPPATLPRESDIRNGITQLEALLRGRVTPAYAKQCLAQMLVAFEPNTKANAEEIRMRAAVWMEANGDLCDGLWRDATRDAIRMLKWMPKPAEFRDLVAGRLTTARMQLDRLRQMLDAIRNPSQRFTPETDRERWQGAISRWRKFGDTVMGRDLKGRAIHAERELAQHENREPADWARVAP